MMTLFALMFSTVASAGTYDLEPEDGRLYVVVRGARGGLLGALAHDHVVVATRYSGTVTYDPNDPSTCDVRIDLPVEGLTVDPGNSRSWAGFDGETSTRDKQTIYDNLSGPDQLESSRFPNIQYRSTSCAPSGNHVQVTGDLTIHGVSKRVSLPMNLSVDGDRLTASGNLELTHADFGMRPYRALAGALRNEERLSFVINVAGTSTQPEELASAE